VPASHKEALGFIVAPQNANHNTITKHTSDEKIQVAQIGLFEQTPYKRGIASKCSYKVWNQSGKLSTDQNTTQENIAQFLKATKHEIFA
jgi:hypothetical protein